MLQQASYVCQDLERCAMQDCNPTTLPFTPNLTFDQDDEATQIINPETLTDFRGKIGSLIYDMKQTWMDVFYSLR